MPKKQWQSLFETLSKFANIELLKLRPHVPDMVFTANAGLVRKELFIPSHFQHLERRQEKTHFRKWFLRMGYRLKDLADSVRLQEAGSCIIQKRSATTPSNLSKQIFPPKTESK